MVSADDHTWLDECLKRLQRARVAVFGDFCLDAYWQIDPDTSELSVETGLPLRRVREQHYSLGGAGNVVANLVALGVAHVRAVGLIGNELSGRQMLDLLTRLGAETRGMLCCQPDWQTMVYGKPCVGGIEQNRIDFGSFNVLRPESVEMLAAELSRRADDSDTVILNQQVPGGVSTPEVIEHINAVVAAHPRCRFLADSRHCAELYSGTMLKVNAHDAARLCSEPHPEQKPVPAGKAREFARRFYERTGQPVFVTRASEGMLVAHKGGVCEIPGIEVLDRIDPVGAGDTAAAALGAAVGSGADPCTAARLADIAGSVTVRKLPRRRSALPLLRLGIAC